MKNRILASAAVAALLLIGSVWLLTLTAPRDPQPIPAVTASDKPAEARDPSPATSAAAQSRSGNNLSPIPAPSPIDLTSPVNPGQMAGITRALDDLKRIYGQAGSLDWDQAKALIARREKASRELVDKLVQLGPGGARAMAAGYADADSTRAKLLLVQALGGINDPDAAGVLQALLGRDPSFSLRKEMVLALSQRKDDAAEQALAGLLASHEDAQLRFASAQALSGRASALPVLAERLLSDPSLNVRAELIHAVGLVRTTAARDVLVRVAGTAGDAALRQTAIQELGRSFGASALDPLSRLLNDPDEAIRKSAVTAAARVKTDAATALLQHTAGADPSAAVRDRAAAAVASLHSGPARAVRAQ